MAKVTWKKSGSRHHPVSHGNRRSRILSLHGLLKADNARGDGVEVHCGSCPHRVEENPPTGMLSREKSWNRAEKFEDKFNNDGHSTSKEISWDHVTIRLHGNRRSRILLLTRSAEGRQCEGLMGWRSIVVHVHIRVGEHPPTGMLSREKSWKSAEKFHEKFTTVDTQLLKRLVGMVFVAII
ncbi:hypothetical protein CEXT_358531 [Caerostris extrusa]|uniref:Uncharacterized protein n=1 Tax=Caerostris extrusa TaxID=172846 RepID=A0AAV4XE93_CAEEX|nr:hypothetical protein CEXT_358531 [Caerostris extrusa]